MLSYGQYQNIVKLATGEEKPGEILVAMKKWARQQYGITLMDTTFDSGYFGSSILSVVVYDVQDFERTGRGNDPDVSAAFCRKYDTPIAVMSTASELVPRRGLYASPSITMPSAVQAIMAISTATTGGRLR